MKVRVLLSPDETAEDILESMEMNITPSENYLEFNTGGGLDYLPEKSKEKIEEFLGDVLTKFGRLLMAGLYTDVAKMWTSNISPGQATIDEALKYAIKQMEIVMAVRGEQTK